jgi:hypothetical protein
MTESKPNHPTNRGDLAYDAFYTGAVGGSVIALFFFIVDATQGHPFYTPSLLGSVLFAGIPAAEAGVRLDMVAYMSIVHFGAFAVLGSALAWVYHEGELHARNPIELVAVVVLVFQGVSFAAAWLLLPGVIEQLGAGRIAVGNLLAGGSMMVFLFRAHRALAETAMAEERSPHAP